MATSATDLIIPIGILLYVTLNPLALFFIFLWRGAGTRLSYSAMLGFILAVLSFVLVLAPQPTQFIYDNQTVSYSFSYMIPQGQTVDLYFGFVVYDSFLIIVASIKFILESGMLSREEGDTD